MVRPTGGPGAAAPVGADLRAVADALGPRARRDHPLGALTTYRVGGPAALYVEAGEVGDLVAVRRALARRPVPLLVLGRGSNLLVSDAGFPGLVVHLGGRFGELCLPAVPATGTVEVRAGSAVDLPVLARRTVDAGLEGLEWAVGVPGSVGGAVRMNAGGHGSDTAHCLARYAWMDLASEAGGEDDPGRLAHGYRSSSVAPSQVVLWAAFRLEPGSRDAGSAALREIVRWRRAHQPGGANAGSVFTNPPGDSAGRLVEAAGLRGHRLDSAQVSPKHANFIQADPGGSADDVLALVRRVQRQVRESSGVALHTEVRLIGFPPSETGAVHTPADPPGPTSARPAPGVGP